MKWAASARPGRREVGHGKLAWRALNPVLPSKEDFPYTIRVLSDITESNGSSSMATVCGGCLSLMDAGVPIKAPVSGIAMGLILEGDEFAVLSDILGDEDHLGDMDFKVAGTAEGITTMQMDIKIAGITREIMAKALEQAKAGRLHILGEMAKALGSARTEVSKHAPRIETIIIDKSKIRDVIGTGGKVIREIVAETGAKIDIDDEGVIKISSSNLDEIEAAKRWILGIVEEPEVGKIYTGKVVNIVDFGAFVNFMGGKDGLVHVSEMKNERVEKPTDVVSEGMEVKVKVLEIDNRGKVRLSMRVVDQETGEELADTRPPREPRAERGGDRRGPKGARPIAAGAVGASATAPRRRCPISSRTDRTARHKRRPVGSDSGGPCAAPPPCGCGRPASEIVDQRHPALRVGAHRARGRVAVIFDAVGQARLEAAADRGIEAGDEVDRGVARIDDRHRRGAGLGHGIGGLRQLERIGDAPAEIEADKPGDPVFLAPVDEAGGAPGRPGLERKLLCPPA
ncbi:MAG: hypothetical protein KatS3mg120_2175 [Erythrobacter sp.]|nr:MAG: hypothetical protein KatS3mg120_2175 [Erythrobacter sp.]